MDADVVGLKIAKVRKMTKAEMRKEGWDCQPPTVIVLEDGTKLYPSQDEEGNGPGVVFGRSQDGSGFYL